jgi:hypothetical protein
MQSPMTGRKIGLLRKALDCILPISRLEVYGFSEWLISHGKLKDVEIPLCNFLELLDALSVAKHELHFDENTDDGRREVLLEISQINHRAVQQPLKLVVNIAVGGLLCGPQYGGDSQHRGWLFVGYLPNGMDNGSNMAI